MCFTSLCPSVETAVILSFFISKQTPDKEGFSSSLLTAKRVDSIMQYPIYKILDDSIPSHKTFIISFNAKDVKKALREKTKIAKINDGNINCINSKWEDNKITGRATEFGEFTLVTDTIQPTIKHIKTDSISMERLSHILKAENFSYIHTEIYHIFIL